MPKITKSLVDKSASKRARYYLWDQSIPGFGLVVQPTGTKSYCFQYRNPQGKTVRITIGTHGTFTTDQARKKAKSLLGKVNSGDDPHALNLAEKEALTISELFDAYLKSAKFAQKTEITRNTDRGRITRHLNPLLGRKVADKLTLDQIRRFQTDIENGKTAKTVKTGPRGLARVTGGPGAARMAVRLLKSAYSWAAAEHLISINPAAAYKVAQDGKREAILENDDYKKLFKAIDELENEQRIRRQVADAIRVIALTGARRGEISGLRWRHVDMKKGVVVIPRGEHKTGKQTDQPRVIGLPSAAQAIVARQEDGSSDEFVFPPLSGKGPISLSKPWRTIRERAGLSKEIGLHGLRHSLATQMAVSGAQAAQIMAVMGHRDMITSQRYIHIAQDKQSELAESAAAGISAALSGFKPADVVKIK